MVESTKNEKQSKSKELDAFRLCCFAPSNYGKSYLISDFVMDLMKKKQFKAHRIEIVSPTAKTDESQLRLIREL